MKTLIMNVMLSCAVIISAMSFESCCTPNALTGTQAVPLRDQETSMWCWAASGEMCMEFLGASITQCDEANKRFGRADCCNSPVPSDCVNGGWPEFEKYGFTANRTSDTPLSWDAIKKQIYCKKKPIAFSWHWNGGGGHMMVVFGYAVFNGVNYVAVHNPLPVGTGTTSFVTYDEYVSGSNHTHWDDFYDITKN